MDKLELKYVTPYLPYRLNVEHKRHSYPKTRKIVTLTPTILCYVEVGGLHTIKPILRHLSELESNPEWLLNLEEDTLHSLEYGNGVFSDVLSDNIPIHYIPHICYEWLLKNHFDVNGLIEAGLAISYKEAGLISDDEQYISIRIARNKERDRLERTHERGSLKTFDMLLEAYEQQTGKERCQSIYLNAIKKYS